MTKYYSHVVCIIVHFYLLARGREFGSRLVGFLFRKSKKLEVRSFATYYWNIK